MSANGEILDVLESSSYREILRKILSARGRGSLSILSKVLKCHPTFVSQVVKGRAEFSAEQAFGFGRWASFEGDDFESFLLLHQWERAGSPELKSYLQRRIDGQRRKREDLKSRWDQKDVLSAEIQTVYFSHPLFQIVHALVQIPRFQQLEPLSQELSLSPNSLLKILKQLEAWGLVQFLSGRWKVREHSLHLSKDAWSIASFHGLWRQVVQSHLQSHFETPGTHYSAIACMDPAAAEQVKKILLKALDASRRAIEPAPSREAYVVALDFFKYA
jgi:hypothetical protein